MATPTAAQSRGLAHELAGILLARPTVIGPWVTVLHLILVLLWHPFIIALVQDLPDDLVWWMSASPTSPRVAQWTYVDLQTLAAAVYARGPAAIELAVTTAVACEGVLAYIGVRIVARRRRTPFALFVRAWWRACLYGIVLIPVALALFGTSSAVLSPSLCGLLLGTYFLVLPAILADAELHPRWRMARWRPVCPECGYSLRRLALPRCPECGRALPVATHAYRRWARPRLAWDRATRGGLPATYVRTLLTIIVCPCRAARGLLLPDRYARAVRWCVAHVLLLALIGTAFGSHGFFWQHALTKWYASGPTPDDQYEAGMTAGVLATWAVQSLLTWIIMLGTLPALGVALGVIWPARHPAARRAIAKWSLYATTVLVLAFLGANAGPLANWCRAQFAASGPMIFHPKTPPALVVVLLYALWWARGVAANPYLRRRGVWVFFGHAALYLAVWRLLIVAFFPMWELQCLL